MSDEELESLVKTYGNA